MSLKLIPIAAVAVSLVIAAAGGARAGEADTKRTTSQEPSTTGTLPKENGQPSVKDLRGHDASSDKPDTSAENLRGHSETPKENLKRD